MKTFHQVLGLPCVALISTSSRSPKIASLGFADVWGSMNRVRKTYFWNNVAWYRLFVRVLTEE